ncbi:hypothetical protein F4Y93_06100 [Candidatus Poribacteria bacterium]|nr:hypothetical protein [Candidatus Poribacteria bacterium]
MKTLIFSAILCCIIALPAVAELTPEDLDKIRLIVKEEVKAEIKPIEIRLQTVEQKVSNIQGRLDGIEKRIAQSNNIMYALIALIIFAIGLPAWQNRRDRKENSKIEELARKVKELEERETVNP